MTNAIFTFRGIEHDKSIEPYTRADGDLSRNPPGMVTRLLLLPGQSAPRYGTRVTVRAAYTRELSAVEKDGPDFYSVIVR